MNENKIIPKPYVWRVGSDSHIDVYRISDEHVALHDPRGNTDHISDWLGCAVHLVLGDAPLESLSLFSMDGEEVEFDLPKQIHVEGSKEAPKFSIKSIFFERAPETSYRVIDLKDQASGTLLKFIDNITESSFAPAIGIIQNRPQNDDTLFGLIQRLMAHEQFGTVGIEDPFKEGHSSALVFNHNIDGFYFCASKSRIDTFIYALQSNGNS